MSKRMESGVVQFGDDWPGVFLRGDEARLFAEILKRVPGAGDLGGLVALLEACERGKSEPERLRPAEECRRPTVGERLKTSTGGRSQEARPDGHERTPRPR